MNRSRMLMLGIAAMLLLGLLAACGSDDDQERTPAAGDNAPTATVAVAEDAEDTGEATSAAASQQSNSSTVEPTATPAQEEDEEEGTAAGDSEETATSASSDENSTPADEESGDRLMGAASVEDEEGDVVNLLMQEPDDPMPGVDLTTVMLEGDGNQIVVTIETAGDIEAELSDDVEVSFDVHLWQDGMPAYALSFHHDGSGDWEATVTDFSVGLGKEETVETVISISGNTLSAAFPGSMLPDLEASFEWYSSVMLSEGGMTIGPNSWFDGAPENVIMLLADPDEFVEFPQ